MRRASDTAMGGAYCHSVKRGDAAGTVCIAGTWRDDNKGGGMTLVSRNIIALQVKMGGLDKQV